MRRLLAAILAAGAAGAVLTAPGPVTSRAQPEVRPVVTALVACPELTVTEGSASTLVGMVAPPGAPDDQPSGSAALRRIDAELDLARISAPGVPVSLLMAGRSQPPFLMRAAGSWAPDAAAGVASNAVSGLGAGLASAACPQPGPEWWFVGAGSELGRGAALLVSNPAEEPARFDIALFARSGPVEALAAKGIDLPPQAHVRLRLDALVNEEDLLAVQVRATGGRVAAALRDIAVPRGESPRGVDFIPPAVRPTTQLHLTGIPAGDGQRELVLVNPGAQFATVQAALITEAGTTELVGLATIAVPAGSVISARLDAVLGGRAATLALNSDVPITGGLRSSWGTSTRDIAWVAAVPALRAPDTLAGAAAVPAGPGLVTTVSVAAPEGATSGTLQLVTTGSGEDSIFTADGPLGSGGLSEETPGGPAVLDAPSRAAAPIRVEVPAGSLRTVTLAGTADAALAHLTWRSDPGSGPALLAHVTRAEDGPAATGYPWWPVVSAVPAVPVREDVGTLAPTR